MVKLTVNGTSRSFDGDGDDDMPLLWYLRDELRLTGTRFGCGAGLCGACTVHVEGQAVRACQTQMSAVQGKRVTTIEGLSPNGTHPVQRAWEQHNVAQCGYCQTGQIMQAVAMLQSTPKPTDADIDRVMTGNVCRCGTTSGSARRSRQRPTGAGHEPRGKRQPPSIPARHRHDRRVRARGESASVVFARRPGAGVPDAGGVVSAQPERLPRDPPRRHRLHRHSPF